MKIYIQITKFARDLKTHVRTSYPPASGLDSADPNGRLAQKAQLSIKLFILIAESENPPRLNLAVSSLGIYFVATCAGFSYGLCTYHTYIYAYLAATDLVNLGFQFLAIH